MKENYISYKSNLIGFKSFLTFILSFSYFALSATCPGTYNNMTFGSYSGPGAVSIEIGGVLTSHDTMTITGAADVSLSTLNLDICSGFVPVNGTTVVFWTTGGLLTSPFATVNIGGNAANLSNWTVRYNYPMLGDISAYYCGYSADITTGPQNVCVNSEFNYEAQITPFTSPATFSWTSTNLGGTFNPNNSTLSGATDFTPGTAGLDSIFVSITTLDGCIAYDTLGINVNPEIIIDMQINGMSIDSAEICENGIVTLDAFIMGGNSVLSYNWEVFVNTVNVFEPDYLTTTSGLNLAAPTSITTDFSIPNNIITAQQVDIVLSVFDATGCIKMDTIHLTVVPEPDVVVTGDVTPICSSVTDENVSLTLSNPNGFGDGFYWEVVYNGATGSYGGGDGCTTGTSLLDTIVNTTTSPVVVEYIIWAYTGINGDDCGDGCLSTIADTIEITVNPYLEIADSSIVLCSDDTVDYNFPSVDDNGTTIDSFSVSSVVGSGLTPATASSGTVIANLDLIADDVFNNVSTAASTVVYTVVPYYAGCAGDTFTITVTVNPEPVVADQTATVCSDSPIGVTLGDDPNGPSAATYNIVSVDLNGLDPVSALAYSGNLVTGNQSFGNRLGMVFTVNSPITVNQLGAFDSNQDGLNSSIEVGIFRNSDMTLVGSSFIFSGTLQPLGADGRHRVTNIAPLVLPADVYTIVAVGYGASEMNGNSSSPPLIGTTTNTGGGSITFNSSSYDGVGFGFPTTPFPTANVFHAGTFQFVSSSTGNGLLANAIVNDSYTNTTNDTVDVVYEVVPVSALGCEGDTFTVTVSVLPEPVTDPSLATATICSDDSTGVVLNTNGTSVGADTWDLVSVTAGPGLVANGGNQTAADDLDEYAISGNIYTNPTNDTVAVVFVVVPVSADGCAGDTFTITVNVMPEPVVADSSFTVCSDEEIGYELPLLGDNLLAIDSFEVIADVEVGLTGTPTQGTGITTLDTLSEDSYNNITTGALDVVYSVIPYSNGCAGDTFLVTVTINPEPVVADTAFTVCSDEAIGYNLPAVGDNGLGIDSFTVSAVVDLDLTGSATVGSGILPGSALAADVYNNVTNASQDVVYTVVPYTNGCSGDTFLITVTVNPEPVVADSTFSVCSDEAIGYNLPALGDNGLAIDSFNVTAIVGGTLIGTATTGTGLTGADLAADVYNNVTNLPDTVVYTITPYSGGCAGNSYELTVEVNPEPVVADSTFSVCSDEAIGYNLPVLGDNGLAIDSFNVTAIVGGTLTGTATTGTGLTGADLATDVYNNVTNLPDTVVYTITPYSGGCAGNSYELTVEVNPEPVVADTAFTICSDDLVGYNLPDLDDDGGDIDSFDISALVGVGLTGTPTTGTGITNLAAIANDTYNNVTPNSIDVVYTITPYFDDCAGDPYTVTVTVDAEPVVANQTVTVCSDVPLGINFNTDPDGPVVEFYTINSITTTLTASAGNPITGDSFAIDSIANDAWTNLTNANQTVVYNVTPVSVDGCEGNPFTVTATIRPEPVVNDIDAVTCSDVTFGGQTQLPVGGTNIGVSQWNFESLDLESPLTSPFPGGTTNNPANYPFTLSNTGIIALVNRAGINNDAFNNIGSFDANAVYSIIPIGPDPAGPLAGCVGDTFFVTGVIHPEPVGTSPAPTEQCSGVPITLNLNDNITNISPDPDSIEPVSYSIISITQSPIALVVINSQSIVDSFLNITATNFGSMPITLNVTIRPESRFGCVGSDFIVPIIINNNPDVSLSPNGDNTLCAGESRTLQGSVTPNISPATYDFEYSITAGTGTLVNANTISATVTATTGPLTIQFKATNPNTGCTDSISYTFTVNPLPTFTTGPNNISACATNVGGTNGVFNLNTSTTGVGTITYHVTNSDALLDVGAIANPGTYVGSNGQTIFVRLEDAISGCFIVGSFTLTVNPLPTAVITGTLSYCDGNSTTLVASGGTSYLWNDLSTNDSLIVNAPGTYTVTVTDANGCTATASTTVTENPKPEAVIAASETAICYGESVTLTASGGDNFEWNTGDVVNQIIVTPDADSTFTVIVENAFGCLDTASITITVFPIPVSPDVDVSLDTCALTFGGTSAEFDLTLVSDSTLTFHTTESDAQNGLGSIVNPTSYTGSNGEVLWFSFIDINGCLIIGSFELVVNPLPAVTVSSTDSEICIGDEVTLTATGGGDYSWSNGETTASIDVSPISTTIYTVTVTNTLTGCTNTSSITITVNAQPTAQIAASDEEICYGESVVLTASGGDNYVWNTGDVVNQITVTPDDDSTYTVVVEDVNGCLDTASIDITVYPGAILPAVETSLDTCALTYGGTSAEFDLTLASDSSLNFYTTESDALNGLGVIVNPTSYTGTNGQLIWVVYADTNGCVAIGSFELLVNPLPEADITSSDLEICLGEETTLTTTGIGTYEWTPGGATTQSIDVSPTSTTVYTVEVTDANGCVNSSSVTVTVNPLPVATITGTDGIECDGETITLVAGGGDSYAWMNGVGNTSSVDVTITSDTTFTVVVTNAFGCTDTTDIDIELNPEILWDSTNVVNVTCNGGSDGEVYALATGGTGTLTYAWEDGDGNAIGSTSTVTGLEAGSYHLTVTDDEGCSITVTLQVTEPAALEIVALVSNNLNCNGDSTGNVSGTIIGGDGPYETFIEGSSSLDSIEDASGFYFENLSADTYVITVVDNSGCSVSTNVEITEPTPLLIAATPVDADCNGGLGTITISGSGGTPGYSYFVNFPVPNTPANSPSFDVPAGTYTVVIEDSHSCRDSVEVTVDEADLILTTTSYTEESCAGSNDGTATVVATSGTPGYTYLWSNGQTTSVATGLTAGEYFVTVYDANGCSVVDSITITTGVAGPPVVMNCPPSDTFYVLDCDISYSWLAPTIVDNCVTTQLTLDLDGAENEGFALGIQQANFEPGVYNVTYTDETANPDTIACAFTITVFDTIVPVVVCPNTAQVQCIEDIPVPYVNYLDFIADGGILDDNCTVSLSTFTHVSDVGLLTPECTNRDTITRTYSVEDIYGNLGICEQTIVVYDTIAPQVNAPADTIVNCDADKTIASTGTATADPDNCDQGAVLIWHSDASNQSGDLDSCDNYNYTITRTWYAQDECGNTDSVNQILTVQDTTKPVAICQNFFVYLDGSGNASIVPDSINNASTDNCMPGALLNLSLDVSTFDCDDVPSTQVVLTVEDACGNASTCTAIVTVADTVAPIAVCNAAITIYLDNLGNASIDSTFLDNGSTDNCAIRNMVVSDSEFDCDDVATSPNPVVLYVYDFYNNVDSCSTNVTVLDTIKPIALCSDITVELDSTGNISITTGMINNGSSDACGIDTMSLDIYSFDCADLDDNTVVLTVTDVNGNSQTCSAVVTVEDNIFPIAICNDITVELDSASGTYTLTALDSAEIVLGTDDNCSFTTTFSDTFFTCLDVFAPVTVLVTYTDPSGNVSTCETDVTVNDVTPPTAVCNDITISLDSLGLYTLSSDDKDSIVVGTFDACSWTYVLDTLSFSCADVGSNGVLATFTDPSANTTTCVVQITVTDTIAPVIVCQDTIINLDSLGDASLMAGELVVSALDACGIDTMVITQTDYTCMDLGPNLETITVTDVNGNSKTCTVTVTVVDTLAPWFTLCKTDTVMNTTPTSCFAPYTSIYFAPIVDNCTPANALMVSSTVKFASGQDTSMIVTPLMGGGYSLSVLPAFGGSLPVGLNTITVYAQDGSGNVDSCVWTVQVNDIWAPAVNNCPSDITVNVNPLTCQAQAFWGGPNASDNCIGISLQTQNNNQWFSGAFFPGGVNNVTLVQYTATDGSGNTNTSCSFTVTVVGTCTPPMPDLSPEHITGGTNYNVGQTKNVVVRVRNLSVNPTTAPIVFYVQKMNPNFTIGVNASQTSTTVGINNYTVTNPDWDILEQPTRWRFTSKAGVVINGNTEKLVGISITANNFPMSSANLSTNIVAGTGGGETPNTNNNKTNVLLVN